MLSIWLVRAVSSTAIAAAAAAAATILDVYDSPLFVWFVFSTWKLLILLDYMLRLAIIILDNFPFFLSLCMHMYFFSPCFVLLFTSKLHSFHLHLCEQRTYIYIQNKWSHHNLPIAAQNKICCNFVDCMCVWIFYDWI